MANNLMITHKVAKTRQNKYSMLCNAICNEIYI